VLASAHGEGEFELTLNDNVINVEGLRRDDQYCAAFQSPVTRHRILTDQEVDHALILFGYDRSQVSNAIAPAHIHGGADHLVFLLNSRAALAAMKYDLDRGRAFMIERDLVTIMFVVAENDRLFHARNAFASGGIYEDLATGAAAAAFSGYLRDLNWGRQNSSNDKGLIDIIQGEDMGVRSVIRTELHGRTGDSVCVSGATRDL